MNHLRPKTRLTILLIAASALSIMSFQVANAATQDAAPEAPPTCLPERSVTEPKDLTHHLVPWNGEADRSLFHQQYRDPVFAQDSEVPPRVYRCDSPVDQPGGEFYIPKSDKDLAVYRQLMESIASAQLAQSAKAITGQTTPTPAPPDDAVNQVVIWLLGLAVAWVASKVHSHGSLFPAMQQGLQTALLYTQPPSSPPAVLAVTPPAPATTAPATTGAT